MISKSSIVEIAQFQKTSWCDFDDCTIYAFWYDIICHCKWSSHHKNAFSNAKDANTCTLRVCLHKKAALSISWKMKPSRFFNQLHWTINHHSPPQFYSSLIYVPDSAIESLCFYVHHFIFFCGYYFCWGFREKSCLKVRAIFCDRDANHPHNPSPYTRSWREFYCFLIPT